MTVVAYLNDKRVRVAEAGQPYDRLGDTFHRVGCILDKVDDALLNQCAVETSGCMGEVQTDLRHLSI